MAGLAAFLGMMSDGLLQDFATAEFSDMFLICSFPVLSESASLAGPVDGDRDRTPVRKACIVESQGLEAERYERGASRKIERQPAGRGSAWHGFA
ncbi:hypothetical protein [Martelella sp. AD-3]|uniref:hypothetical protein n=1 Tax=Martelella sp. AD-3 TaxID=686597 RepID=UPI0012695C28|nr:hypothetical protein [Martelella sp. AD-3]